VLLADARARFERLRGRPVVFTTGTDEHGLKVFRAAETHGEPTLAFCDRLSAAFRAMNDSAHVSYTRYAHSPPHLPTK
jgi:methionyl-tRNA synthetase